MLTNENPLKVVPKLYSPVKIPPDQCIDNNWVTIIDSWHDDQNDLEEALKEDLDQIHLILLLFDISNTSSIKNITNFWLKALKPLTSVPIIAIGNKIDKKNEFGEFDQNRAYEEICKSRVEGIFECSCLTLEGIAEIFLNMQKIILYPYKELVDVERQELRPDFVRALKFVYRKIDKNKDFFISDHELMQMQLEVFNEELSWEAVHQILEKVLEENPEGVIEGLMNFEGFCTLQLILIKNSQTDICWKTLFYFGFDRNFKLVINLPSENLGQKFLSRSAASFLLTVFDQYCEGGLLTCHSVSKIFEPCPCSPNNKETVKIWKEIIEKVKVTNSSINFSSWLAYWTLLCYQSPEIYYKFLVYIGCCLSFPEAFSLNNEENSLKVVYLAGINAVGKSFIINTMLEKSTTHYIPTSSLKSYCIALDEHLVPWLTKFLIMFEVPLIEAEEVLKTVKNSEYILVLTNETKESQEFIPKLRLNSQNNLRILRNSSNSLNSSKIFNYFLNLSPISPQSTYKFSSKSLTILASLFLFISILYKYLTLI